MSGAQIMVVTIEGTTGWGTISGELVASLRRCGVSAQLVGTGPVPQVRTMALTDLTQALAARKAASAAMRADRPAAVVYCSSTAALLWPRRGAIWLDAAAAENRPGRHGIWQRPLERRRIAQAPLVMAMSERTLDPLRARGVWPQLPEVTMPVPVESSLDGDEPERDIAALSYAPNPEKKGLPRILEAWRRARRSGETLLVAGADPALVPRADGVDAVGTLPREQYRSLLRRSRVFVAAPRFEDYGIAQLEALADGCRLVTVPGAGPYPARELARELDRRLVDDDLVTALRLALDDPLPGYSERARELLLPFSRGAVDRTMATRVLPALLES